MVRDRTLHPNNFVTPHLYARERFRRCRNGRGFNAINASDSDWETIERYESDWTSYHHRHQFRS